MQEKVIVMSGSFNPPTIAHVKLLRCALDGINASRGYVVPASQAYIKRKMIKAGTGHLCIPDQTRLDMLKASFAGDERVVIYTDWLNEAFAVTYEIMCKIQSLNPEADVYFLSGADKINLLEELCAKNDFLQRFGVIIFARDGKAPDKMIESSESLARYKDSIVCLQQPDGIAHISSTAIREHLFDADCVSDMLHPEAVKYIKALNKDDFPEEIVAFKDEYSFLGIIYPVKTEYEGLSYPSAESAFQASKLKDNAGRKRFAECSPDKAKSKGAAITPYDGWENGRLSIMEKILESKFSDNPELRQKLLSTGNKKLIYGNKKKDTYWGTDPITWEGENNLGKILMKIRNKLTGGRQEAITMKYNVDLICERYNRGEELEFIFFWGHTTKPGKIKKSCLSQWYDCRFEKDGVLYHTTEQYMMSQKALLFGDTETYEKIMASADPKDYKALGREVKNFKPEMWDAKKYEIVLAGNILKFSQNEELKNFLLETGDKVLAEASPYDGIWGVCLAMDDPLIADPNNWNGENLLGFALMETRDILRGTD